MAKRKEMIGKTFGRLFVLSVAGYTGTRKRLTYNCICSCGKEKVVRAECLRNGMTKSCGCLKIETIGNLNKSHSMTNTPEYKSWAHAKSRTTNPSNKKFEHYGARGIKMCDEWLHSFEAFFKDMGKKPSKNHSLGRIDVEKGYSKENCRWETSFQQARARTDNVFVIVDDKKMILKDACKLKNLNYKQVSASIKNNKLKLEEIFL